MVATISSSPAAPASTIWRIVLRMLIDAALRDSNTLSPSHSGQAMRWAMLSARSAGVLGPLSRLAPTASNPTTTNTSSSHAGQRLIAALTCPPAAVAAGPPGRRR